MVCDIKNPERMHCKCLYEEEAWVQDVSASNLTFQSKSLLIRMLCPLPAPLWAPSMAVLAVLSGSSAQTPIEPLGCI